MVQAEMKQHSPVHPGFSRFHHTGLLIPLGAVTSLMWTSRLARPHWPQSVNALVSGFIVGSICFVLLKYSFLKEAHPLGKAVMLGLLHAEFQVFARTRLVPPIVNICFFLFMYFFAFAEFDDGIKH
jgi:hypothetical protein